MSRCNQISMFLLYSNIIYDIIYENNLDIQLWYGKISDTLMNAIIDCTEINKVNLRQLMEVSLIKEFNIPLIGYDVIEMEDIIES